MRIASLLGMLLLASLSGLLAQTADRPWALSAGGGVVSYQEHPGTNSLQNGFFDPAYQVGVNKYLAGAFDFRVNFMYSPKVNFPTSESNFGLSSLYDMSYNLIFKLNNGVLFKENGFIGPYLRLGVGGSYTQNNPDVYVPLGGGVRFKLSPKSSIRVETTKKISVNKDYQHIAHAVAFVYNLKQKDKDGMEELKETEIDEDWVVSALIPKDTDQDGVVDNQDDCPTMKGYIQWMGCPTNKDEKEYYAQVEDPLLPVKDQQIEVKPAVIPAVETQDDDEPYEITHLSALGTPKLAQQNSPMMAQAEEVKKPIVQSNNQKESPARFETNAPSQPEAIDLTNYADILNRPEKIETPCGTFNLAESNIQPILFDLGSDKLPHQAKESLREVAKMMQSCSDTELVLQGHTDAIGSTKDNMVLSILRAYNVKYFLVYEFGISQNRISSRGLGEAVPQADNETDSGREMNRRVDFLLRF